jgi:KUP system potassium uptake protein
VAEGKDTRTLLLGLGALGVVYGDIGTNPLFAMREAFVARHHVDISEANVLGLLSLMFWALLLVICLKYLTFVMRVDNDGEGGIVALAAMALGEEDPGTHGRRWVVLLLGLFGAALLYGDGIITPAISVLAAVEGTTLAAPGVEDFVVPAAVAVLIALFAFQHTGTATIGRVFGPVMVVWFTTIAVLGATQVARRPGVLTAVDPRHGVRFFADNGVTGFLVLGAVILVVVGGEALYADLGHFGRRPIQVGWYVMVLPSLVLVYFGQGALLLREPDAIENPFFRMGPSWSVVPLVVLATMATVIASQALISGAFSLTHQAIRLGYLPRMRVRHTSEEQIGQIYLPFVNWVLMVACIGLVLGFRHSANLAAAYGLAVTTTMVITTVLFAVVARQRLRWPRSQVVPLCLLFLVVDLAFFGATLFKIPEGGWLPLVVAALVFTLLSTWRTGHLLVNQRVLKGGLPLEEFVAGLEQEELVRSPGASAFLFAAPGVTPPSLLAMRRQADALHEQVLIVSVETARRPRVRARHRSEVTDLGLGFHRVVLRFGYLEPPDVPAALAGHVVDELGTDLEQLSYIVGREVVQVTPRPGMAAWREHLFAFMSRNARDAPTQFRLPPEQTIELGVPVEL